MKKLDGEWAIGVGEIGDHTILPLYFGGYSYYVRKCIGPDEIGGILMPEKYNTITDCSRWNEVVGVGPKVGTRCSKRHAKRFKRASHITNPARAGDWLMVPQVHEGIYCSPLLWYEFFIEESISFAIWRYEDNKDAGKVYSECKR